MSLNLTLKNSTSTADLLYCFVTGTDPSGRQFLVQSNGTSLFYVDTGDATIEYIPVNCAIEVGSRGVSRTITVPTAFSGRIWFSEMTALKFRQVSGGIIPLSVTDKADPNINVTWDFMEITVGADGSVFCNISYVDFFSIPIALTLTGSKGTQHVSGTDENGLTTVASQLQAQQKVDKAGWDQLIVPDAKNNPLRILSPNSLLTQGQTKNAFPTFWDSYSGQVWQKYQSDTLTVETPTAGKVTGKVTNGVLAFSNGPTFTQPRSADIWKCSSGPFNSADKATLEIIPRLAAAFQRSTLLAIADQPNGSTVNDYYKDVPVNYYNKIVHAANLDGNGYTFPYDDLTPAGQPNVCGSLTDPHALNLTVTVGGNFAYK